MVTIITAFLGDVTALCQRTWKMHMRLEMQSGVYPDGGILSSPAQ